MKNCPRCGYKFGKQKNCTCQNLNIFNLEIYLTGKHKGKNFCNKCGGLLTPELVEFILCSTAKKLPKIR